MQWTDEEPDAADLPNLLAHKDWAKDRVDEIDQVGRIVQNTVDGIGSAWVGEAAAAWKSGVSEIIEVLSQCKYEYQSLEAALGPLHSGLSSLRSSMDGVRQVEMAWGFTLQEHQGIAEQRASWLIVNDPASRGHSLETVPTIGCYPDDTPDIQRARIDLLAARDMVTTAEKVLAEAQAEREEGVRKRRTLDSDASAALAAAQAAMPKTLPAGIGDGSGVIPVSFGLSLIRKTLAGLSNQQLRDLFGKPGAGGDLAKIFAGKLPAPGDSVPGLGPAVVAALAALVNAPATLDRREKLTVLFAAISPEDASRLALLFPGLGNIDGVPFTARYDANRINVAAALKSRQDNQGVLDQIVKNAQAKLNQAQKNYESGLTTPIKVDNNPYGPASNVNPYLVLLQQAKEALTEAQNAASENFKLSNMSGDPKNWGTYWKYLNELTPTYAIGADGKPALGPDGNYQQQVGHQILVFSDEGPGAVAEVWGNVNTAKQIGVAVPGTTTTMSTFPGASNDQAKTFMDKAFKDKRFDQSMISWAGGEFPQKIPFVEGAGPTPPKSAGDPSYANDLGQRLYRFNDALAAQAPGAKIAVGGHSYGGSVVGEAEQLGMEADRVLFIESAGTGPGVHGIYDYPHANTTKYYQMTAPGDPIFYSQLSGVHGEGPTFDPGITPLETGFLDDTNRPGSGLVQGVDAHGGVFTKGSTAWKNMYGFYTNQQIEAKAAYSFQLTSPGYQPPLIDVGTDQPYAATHTEQEWQITQNAQNTR